MNTNTVKSPDLSFVQAEAAAILPRMIAFTSRRFVSAAEFVWKGMFDTEMRISVGPGEYRDAKSEVRDQYRHLGRLQ